MGRSGTPRTLWAEIADPAAIAVSKSVVDAPTVESSPTSLQPTIKTPEPRTTPDSILMSPL